MITNNPWLAGNIESFLFLNCPECTFKTKQKHIFQGHAIENHPLSCELFNESFNPEIFDPGHLDISSKYDKTLEEVMFEDDLPLDVGLDYIDEKPKTPKKFKRRMYNDMDKDEFEKELLHMCTFCDSSFKDLPALKTHIKRHQNVLPLALYVTREESFVRSYNNKKKIKTKKAEDLEPEKKRKGNFKPEGAKMMKCHKAGCNFETWSNAYLDTHINKSKNQPRYFLKIYRTGAIITRGLYIFYPILKIISLFSRRFFQKILALCTVRIQERFLIKSGL